jgi:Phosphotransferase system IIC components, glucose/maltose/N-acetylglucosamine-specific
MNSHTALCNEILSAIGGKENIDSVAHCATRLRLTLKDLTKVSKNETVKSIKGVLGLVTMNNSYQIIIGPGVDTLYLEFIRLAKIKGSGIVPDTDNNAIEDIPKQKEKLTAKKAIMKAIDFISGSFLPTIPVIVAGGLISAILVCCTTFFNMNTESGTYIVLNAIYAAAFTYLPIYVGYNTAKKLGVTPMLGALLGGVMVSGNISGVENLNFMGIPIATVNYAQSVLPVMFAVLFMAFVYRPLEKRMPKEIKFVMVPVLTMLITVPITLIAIGPMGTWLGDGIATVMLWLSNSLGGGAVSLLAAFFPVMLFTGTGGGLFPAIFASFETYGYEGFIMTSLLAANLAMGGAAIATSFKLKNKDNKSVAMSTGLTAIFGITEPAIYGTLVRWKKPFIAAIIGSAIGGLFAGMMNVVEYVFSSPSVISIIAFMNPDGTMRNFIMAIITMIIAFGSAFIITLFMKIEEDSTLEN